MVGVGKQVRTRVRVRISLWIRGNVGAGVRVLGEARRGRRGEWGVGKGEAKGERGGEG